MTKEQTMKNIRLSAATIFALPLHAAGLLLTAGLLLAACGGRASQQKTRDDGYVMELDSLSTTVGLAALEIGLTGPGGAGTLVLPVVPPGSERHVHLSSTHGNARHAVGRPVDAVGGAAIATLRCRIYRANPSRAE
jgi:hypothetical protein